MPDNQKNKETDNIKEQIFFDQENNKKNKILKFDDDENIKEGINNFNKDTSYMINSRNILGGRDEDQALIKGKKSSTGLEYTLKPNKVSEDYLNKVYNYMDSSLTDKESTTNLNPLKDAKIRGSINKTNDKFDVLQYRGDYDKKNNINNVGDMFGSKGRNSTLMGDVTINSNFVYNGGIGNTDKNIDVNVKNIPNYYTKNDDGYKDDKDASVRTNNIYTTKDGMEVNKLRNLNNKQQSVNDNEQKENEQKK